ncbi:hypothetical protein SAMN05216189_104824 [Pseudomonas delhiensis]|uniref:Uncharacterized protein n=1 Tax=Pseudomonas delhiensis TaxID=366289 RepID=A0A239LMH4_9PSED|nr:hypothetical protein SAMN05216189_104824 [Pseudomonas delhiensis]SNT31490.1 hypothetical protein SAMN06295949_12117 [Pseudomonas delhiensis]
MIGTMKGGRSGARVRRCNQDVVASRAQVDRRCPGAEPVGRRRGRAARLRSRAGAWAWPLLGPGHGHGLPDYARSLWIGSALYFVAAGTYYLWNADRRQYVVVEPPPAVQQAPAGVSYDVIAYPARGQTPDQQSRDRYECHTWAVGQSGFDPAAASQAPAPGVADTYRRALGACLNGRGYSIN